jgi:hypothetical protein
MSHRAGSVINSYPLILFHADLLVQVWPTPATESATATRMDYPLVRFMPARAANNTFLTALLEQRSTQPAGQVDPTRGGDVRSSELPSEPGPKGKRRTAAEVSRRIHTMHIDISE